jgi:hypothetical protein
MYGREAELDSSGREGRWSSPSMSSPWTSTSSLRERSRTTTAVSVSTCSRILSFRRQGLTIAGVSPVVGLYAAPGALILYAAFGSSRHLVVGPMAATAAVSAAAVGDLAAGGSDEFLQLTITMGIVVGVLALGAGLCRLGFLASFISEPVLKGFIIGLALTIIVGQLPRKRAAYRLRYKRGIAGRCQRRELGPRSQPNAENRIPPSKKYAVMTTPLAPSFPSEAVTIQRPTPTATPSRRATPPMRASRVRRRHPMRVPQGWYRPWATAPPSSPSTAMKPM